MLIDEKVIIKVAPVTSDYWKKKGYQFKIGQEIEVNVYDLPSNSNIYVNCKCDNCQNIYKQRFSRNKKICGHCNLSIRMRSNKLGEKNKKMKSPPKDELLELLNSEGNKSIIAKKYNVSITVVNTWLKENEIELEKYYGRKYFKTVEDEQNALCKIISLEKKLNIEEISKLTNIPRNILTSLRKKYSLEFNSQFEIWKKSYDNIIKNIDFFVAENKTKNLKTISDENNISYEQLIKAFKELNLKVHLHSYNKSKGELECKEFIKNLGENCFSCMLSKKFEIDCFVPEKRVGVEYCGEYWHRFVPEKDNKYYHRNKFIESKKNGLTLLTIFENEWKNKKEIVQSIIKSKLGLNKKIFARKCEIKEIIKYDAELFHDKNHISGFTNSSINIGLYYENELVSVLSFIKSRFSKDFQYEISRFSSKQGFTIVGGLSRMFNYFVKVYNPKSCVTYSDLRFGEGLSYEKIGFKYIKTTPPNYYYYHKEKQIFESRMRYQKHKLKNMKSYDENLSEFQIMQLEGFFRIYDCGNKKYGWENPTHI